MTILQRRWLANLGLIGSLLAAAVLYRFSPQQYSFYPRCPFYTLLGIRCPGCGSTRACAELLHGHLMAALHWNPVFVGLFPLLLLFGIRSYLRALRTENFVWPHLFPTRIPLRLRNALR